MRAADLDLSELLSMDEGGLIHFGGQRALIFDAVALGLLRHELIKTLGFSAARCVLTRFGYAHGWRTAESLKTAYPWDDDGEWRAAGARLHTLQGQVIVLEEERGPGELSESLGGAVWQASYEAEQHLLHLGRAEEPVCWTLAGFASGYSSYVYGRKIYCVEDRCVGKGDPVCRLVGKTAELWGKELDALLPFFESARLDEALAHVTAQLKAAESKLRARRNALGPSTIAPGDVQSPAMRKVLELARRVAKVDSTVLVTGESGAGKERIARLIHDESARVAGPFIAINCGAVPESLLESELFGHVKGAFTGATTDRPGLFEAANGGTLFLDEIGEVPRPMQVKLLRTLQEREVRRVGENKVRKVDARVVAATNRDLAAEVRAGHFRQDLYYRLRVIELKVPPLRERRDDILPLARTFLKTAADRARSKVTGLTPEAASQLVRYPWPGNVRELENAIERAVVLASGSRVDVSDLPEELGQALPAVSLAGHTRPLEEIEREYILAVLKAEGGNKVKAAEQLQIGTATLYRKLKEYEAPHRKKRRA